MNWKRILGWIFGVIFLLVIVVFVGGYFVLRSGKFHRYVISKVEQTAAESTGGRVEIQSYDLQLSKLTVNVYGLVIHGTEPAGARPLLAADRIKIRLKILSVWRQKVDLNELVVDHPVASLLINKAGRSNIPSPNAPRQKTSNTNIFDLAVGHVLLNNGEIYYNDDKTPLYADVYNLGANIGYTALKKEYSGSLSYEKGELKYSDFVPLRHDLQTQFTATPDKATLGPLDARIGGSRISLRAEMTNYSEPNVSGSYNILIHTSDFASKPQTASATGDVVMAGSLSYRSNPDQPLLRSVVLNGELNSRELKLVSPQAQLPIKAIHGRYELANGNFAAKALAMDLLNGKLVADVNIHHLDTTPSSQINASLKGISIQAAQQALKNVSAKNVVIAGTINGGVEASWTGSMKDLRARSDVTMRAAIHNSGNTAGAVPISGAIHASYDSRSGNVTLQNTLLRGPASSIVAQGTIGQRSNLVVHARTTNIHDLILLASALQTSPAKTPAISGPATLNATVTGSMKQPRINAQLAAQNLQVEGSQWRTLQLNAQASPSAISLQNGRIVNAHGGQITFTASVGLKNWSYTPSSPITAAASAQQMPVAALQQLAQVNYPVSGFLSANVNLHGSQLNPIGNGSLQLTKASAYDQPIQNLTAQFNATGNTVDSTLNIKLPAGAGTAHLLYYPKNRGYQLQMNVPGMNLQQLQKIQAKNVPVNGTLTASASGSGTLDNPQLTATVQIPRLQVRETTITGMKADLSVANHRAAFAVGTDVAQATIRARGTVDLTGGYYTDATLDTSRLPVVPLLAAYVTNIPNGAQGELEIHASVQGPIKDKSRLQAHLVIPTLSASYQQLQIANSGPIRADYANAVLVLQPAELKGTDTQLRVQGRVPVQGTAPMDVTANGSVNLKLISIFNPDLQTAGTLTLDVRGSGNRSRPGVTGQIRLQKVALVTTGAPVGVQNLNGVLDVNNGKILVSQLQGEAGGGQISAGGSITYEPQIAFNLALTTKGVRVLYPSGVRTIFDSSLAMTGTRQDATLNGRVLVDSLAFTPDFDLASFMSSTSTPSLPSTTPTFQDNVKLDVAVQTTSNLQATSSELSVEGDANLRIIGTAANPVVTGRTDLTSGEVFFMKQRYQLERGIINFVNATRTEPNVDILITTVIQQYNLSLTIVGPVEKLRTSYTSDPPLPPVDIINLIARGQTTEESAPGNFSANQVIAGELASQVSSRVGKFAGISSLTIDPNLGGSGTNPSARIAVQQRVTRNFIFTFSTDVTNPQAEIVQGEYQLNPRWGVSATRDQYGGFAFLGKYHKSF